MRGLPEQKCGSAAGTTAGTAIGSAVPVVGTVIGRVVGDTTQGGFPPLGLSGFVGRWRLRFHGPIVVGEG